MRVRVRVRVRARVRARVTQAPRQIDGGVGVGVGVGVLVWAADSSDVNWKGPLQCPEDLGPHVLLEVGRLRDKETRRQEDKETRIRVMVSLGGTGGQVQLRLGVRARGWVDLKFVWSVSLRVGLDSTPRVCVDLCVCP